MKTQWQETTLGNIFDITSSKRVFKSDWVKEGVPFYRAREIVSISEGRKLKDPIFVTEEMYQKYAEKYGKPEPGDILVTGVGTLGICYVVKEGDKFYFKDGNIIWLKNKSEVNPRFVEYFFKTDALIKQIKSAPVGATVGTFTIIRAKETKINLPSLSEQKRIVKILDEKFEAIEKLKKMTEEQLASAKELFEISLKTTFQSLGEKLDSHPIQSVAKFKSGNTISKSLEKESGDLLYIKVGDMNLAGNEKIITTSSRFVSKETIPQSHRIPEGSILFPKRGGAILTNKKRINNDEIVADLNIMSVQPGKSLDLMFLFYWFQTFKLEEISNGSSILQINNYSFDDVSIPVPTLVEQKQIVKELDALYKKTSSLSELLKQKIVDIEELKKSYLEQAFAGKL